MGLRRGGGARCFCARVRGCWRSAYCSWGRSHCLTRGSSCRRWCGRLDWLVISSRCRFSIAAGSRSRSPARTIRCRSHCTVERAYPEFNDSLVSAVQFLNRDAKDRTSSPGLRKAAIRRAAHKAERYEFERTVDGSWTKRSMLFALAVVAGAGWLGYSYQEAARTAILRIAVPFGGAVAPTQTKIAILAPNPSRIGSRTANRSIFACRSAA